jgi:hypothetical protein
MHIRFTIATLALTFLGAVHEGLTGEPEALQGKEGAPKLSRNHYKTILQEIEELTARIHREVDQVLADYKRDTAEYHRRIGAKEGIIIKSDEAPPTTMATTSPSPKPDKPIEKLGNLKFKKIKDDFEKYQTHATPLLKDKIIMELNDLMALGQLKDDQKQEAIKIADDLNDQDLKVSLNEYYQAVYPIIEKVLKGERIEDIRMPPHTGKNFSLLPISTPPAAVSATHDVK